MDGGRFDRLTRELTTAITRRRTLHGLAGGAIAGLLAHLGREEAAAACIKPGRKGCAGPKNKKCCRGARCKGGSRRRTGRCDCKRGLTNCRRDCVSTRTDPDHCGRCNKRCEAGHSCQQGICTSQLGCRVTDDSCQAGVPTACPGSDNPSCLCLRDVHGTPHCSDLTDPVDCTGCAKNADCPDGFMCINASTAICNTCDGAGNGNGCVRATCDGKS